VIQADEGGIVLAAAFAGEIREIPPRQVPAEHHFATTSIDDAVAHHTGVIHAFTIDEHLTSAESSLCDRPHAPGRVS
jgi:hypothetical protein